jgi:hypothetical protein
MKKRLIVLSAALLVALYALSAFAANVTGKWTAEDKDPDGDPSTITYVFKQEGTQLTGTVAIPAETANISNGKVDGGKVDGGKVDGDKVSFVAVFSFGTITHTGTVHEDEITLTVKSDDPPFTTHEITLKRSK